MREIKYKVWYRGRMYDRVNLRIEPDYTAVEIVRGRGENIHTDTEKAKLLQFTGLHDKNRKEIYEGDIVQSKDWHTDVNGRCVLSDANSYLKKQVVNYTTGLPFVGFTIPCKCEVIGNIYEHLYLLDVKE
jgi:uncharacterized phage protein (TIGR01671 family)